MQSNLLRYIPTFLQVAEDLNFSESARTMGVTPAAVSKAIRTLETGLGTRLFHRTTHKLTLTADGEQLMQQSAPHQRGMVQALSNAMSKPEHPHGKLRVSAPYAFSRQYILPLLKGFCEKYPDVKLDLYFDDQVVDMVEGRIDVGIGVRLAPSNDLIIKKLCDSRLFIVAASAFLENHGTPAHPLELVNFPTVRFRSHSSGTLIPWVFVDENGNQKTIDPAPAVTVSSQELVCELAAQGLGIAMTGWVALPYIQAGELIPLFEDFTFTPPPLSIYYHAKANLPAKVRVFIDYVDRHMVRPGPGTWPKQGE